MNTKATASSCLTIPIARSAKRCARFVFGPANARLHFFSFLVKRLKFAKQNFYKLGKFLQHICKLCSKFERNRLSLSQVMKFSLHQERQLPSCVGVWVGGCVGCDKKSKPSLRVSSDPISLKIVEDM